MKRYSAVLALLALAISAFAQTPTMTPVYSTATADWQIKPIAVPTMTTTVIGADAYLKTITVSNSTSGAIAFSVCDKQGSPICAVPAISVEANSVYVIPWPFYYWCPSGFTVLAGGSGLTFYVSWRQ
jgi:hypothetical protein